MGALHEGHASLIRLARRQCGYVAVSVFVNPTQFGPSEDFTRYPRTWDADLAMCERDGVDLVFAPELADIYPPGYRTFVEVTELGDHLLRPRSRPGHFRGVATVVLKLLNIVEPDRAYFGQKDIQQARIIQQLVRDLNVPVECVIAPTVRRAGRTGPQLAQPVSWPRRAPAMPPSSSTHCGSPATRRGRRP